MIIAPDGKKYSLTKRGRITSGVIPFISDPDGIRLPVYKTLVDAVIDPATHPGIYTIHLALIPLHSIARAETALAVATEKVTVE